MIRKLTALPAPGGATAAVVPAAEPAAATEGEPGTAPAGRATVNDTDESGTPRSSVPREPVCPVPVSRISAARAASSRARWAPPCHRPAA
ncbi:hypothetical protein AB0M34_07965 [Nocardia sp. NPDC050193]